MPGWRRPDDPQIQWPENSPPPPPPHVVDAWRFPAPTREDLAPAIADKELAYLASLALLRAPPEFRVLAHLLLRLFEEKQDNVAKPPWPGPSAEAG